MNRQDIIKVIDRVIERNNDVIKNFSNDYDLVRSMKNRNVDLYYLRNYFNVCDEDCEVRSNG